MTETDKIVEIVYEWINKEKTPTPRNLKSRLNKYFNTRHSIGVNATDASKNNLSGLRKSGAEGSNPSGESRKARVCKNCNHKLRKRRFGRGSFLHYNNLDRENKCTERIAQGWCLCNKPELKEAKGQVGE